MKYSIFLLIGLCFFSCQSEDKCNKMEEVYFYPTDTTWLNQIGSNRTRSIKSNKGNFQSIDNAGITKYAEFLRPRGIIYDAEQCRKYFKQMKKYGSRTSIYGILVDFEVVFDPQKKSYYFMLTARDYETFTTFMTHTYVLQNPDVNQSFDFNFHSSNFDTSYAVVPQKFDVFTNLNGLSFKEVYLFQFPYTYMANSPAYLRRIWFSKYDGVIAYETVGGEKWDCLN